MSKKRNSDSWGEDTIIKNPEEVLTTVVGVTSSTSQKMEKRRVLKFTPRRKQIFREFLRELINHPRKYGEIGGNEWINDLIPRFGEPKGRTCLVTGYDVKHWLKTEEFAQLYQRVQEAEAKVSSSSSEPQTPESSRSLVPTSPSLLSSSLGASSDKGAIQRDAEENSDGISTGSSDSPTKTSGGFLETVKSKEIPGPSCAAIRSMPKIFPQAFTSSSENVMDQPSIPLAPPPHQEERSQRLEVAVQSHGIFVKLPAMTLPTSFFMLPTSWTARVLQRSIVPPGSGSGNPSLLSTAEGQEEFGFDPDTLEASGRDAESRVPPPPPSEHSSYLYPDSVETQDLSNGALLLAGMDENSGNATNVPSDMNKHEQ